MQVYPQCKFLIDSLLQSLVLKNILFSFLWHEIAFTRTDATLYTFLWVAFSVFLACVIVIAS